MEEFDAIIVGAGPAGGSCARELSESGKSVLLLEKSKVIGLPNFSTAGTPNETMKVFELPKKVTDSPWKSLYFGSKNREHEFNFGKRVGYVLNYMKLKQYLAAQAKKSGTTVITGSHADDVIKENGRIVGVIAHIGDEKKEFRGNIVVDASGGRATLSQKLGIMKPDKNYLAVGVEYHMKDIDFERKESLDVYIGKYYVRNGYAWIFPMGKNSAKVGITSIGRNDGLKKLLDVFVKNNDQAKDATILDLHSGSLFANGGVKNHALDGFLAIGDAAGQINPLAGEGIRHALYSGRFAAETIYAALENKNFTKEFLSQYNTKWRNYVGDKWKKCMMYQKLACALSGNDTLPDKLVEGMNRITPSQAFDIFFNYKLNASKSSMLVRILGLMAAKIFSR